MKVSLLTLLCLLLWLPACTIVHTDANKGTSTLASLGGDMSDYAGTPNGATFTRMDNSSSFRELNKSIRFGLGVAAAANVAKSGLDAWKSTSNTKTAADVSKNAASQSRRGSSRKA